MAENQGNYRGKTTRNEKKYKKANGQPRLKKKSNRAKSDNVCPYAKKCGGCDYQGVEYKEQLKTKQAYMKKLLKPFCFVEPIVGMKNPLYYRYKVHAAFDCTRRGQIVAGAIGIEPTQWESEAQVLPLHQAPSQELLYITKDCFAIDFLCRNKKITAQMIFFEIIDLFLLQK